MHSDDSDKPLVKNNTKLTRIVSSATLGLYTLEGGGSMSEAVILERQEQATADGGRLNSKATKEIEALLETSDQYQVKKASISGRWYFRMPQAGVKYYSI